MLTPQFITVSAADGSINLDDLKPTGDDTSENVSVRVLDSAGRTVPGMSYTWNDWSYDDPCWVDDDGEAVEGITFPQGQGLWVYGSDNTQGLQSAGQVAMSDVVVTLRAGATPTGNPFPMSVSLSDIYPTGDDTSENVSIRILDSAGRTAEGMSYTWNDWSYDDPCWVDDDGEAVDGVVFGAGQGLWVYGSSAKQGLYIPAPEL